MTIRTKAELVLWLASHPKLEWLSLNDYQDTRLPALPPSVVSLSLYDCPNLESLNPETVEAESGKKGFWKRGISPRRRIYLLPDLRELWVNNCPLLTESFAFSATIRNIAFIRCRSLRLASLAHLRLTWLYLIECPLVDLPVLPSTEQLVVESCGFSTMPELPKSLTLLHWRNTCTGLRRLPVLPPELEMLDIAEMPNLEFVPTLPVTLEHFDISFCDGITLLPDASATQLYRFSVWKCSQIEALPTLPATLAVLFVQECQSIKALKLRRDLKLRIFHVNDCPLKVIEAFPDRLCSLHLTGLPELSDIPEIGSDVRYVYIDRCSQLQLEQPFVLDRQLRTTSGAFVDDPAWPD